MTISGCRALALDLDGTLIDSRADIAAAANYALEQHGHAPLPVETIASFVGDGASLLIQRASGWTPEHQGFAPLLQTFFDYYIDHAAVETQLYPGVRSTLNRIAESGRFLMALCTNKPRAPTDRILDQLELGKYFQAVFGGDDVPDKKPAPDMLLAASRQIEVPPQQIVMVGDGPQDIESGKRAGAMTIGVTYGIKAARFMRQAKPDMEIDAFVELLPPLGLG